MDWYWPQARGLGTPALEASQGVSGGLLVKMSSLGKLKRSRFGDAGLRISDSVLGLMSGF